MRVCNYVDPPRVVFNNKIFLSFDRQYYFWNLVKKKKEIFFSELKKKPCLRLWIMEMNFNLYNNNKKSILIRGFNYFRLQI